MSDEREDSAYYQSPDVRSVDDVLHSDECDELLAAYSASELYAEEEAAVRQHLEHCMQCRQSLDELNRIRALLATLPAVGNVSRAEPLDPNFPVRPVSPLPGVVVQMRHDTATLEAPHTPHTIVNRSSSRGELGMVKGKSDLDMGVEESNTADGVVRSSDISSNGWQLSHVQSYKPSKSLTFASVAAALIIALLGAGLFGVLGPRLRHTAPVGNSPIPATSTVSVTPTSTLPAIPLDPRTGLPKDGTLSHIQIISPDDAWALGQVFVVIQLADHSYSKPYFFLAHFDGTTWQPVRGTYTSTTINDLAMTSSTEGWAVGADEGSPSPFGVILHYKNGRWERTNVLNMGGFYRIHMLSADEGWAMGPTSAFWPASTNPPFIMHYSHGVWTHVTTPIQQAPGDFSFDKPDHGWLVDFDGLIASYSHGTWAKWPQSQPGDLNSTSSLSGDDAWAVGATRGEPPSTPPAPVVLHFDGRSWLRISVPALGSSGTLRQIVMLNASEGWLIGTLFPSSSAIQPVTETPIVLHYTGGAWQRATMPAPPGYEIVLSDISMSPNGDGWASASLNHLSATTGKNGVDSSTFVLLRYHAGVWSIFSNS